MSNELLINVRDHETRVALLEDGGLVELFTERRATRKLVGNIYRGRVTRILPGMQAAFVDIGLERTAFLYVADIHRGVANMDMETFEPCEAEEDHDYFDADSFCSTHVKEDTTKIDDLLREGQHIMVQVAKEPIGAKGARLTSYLSIPGRYLVLTPTVDHVGVSRLIEEKEKKERLKGIIREIKPPNLGFIVRTVSENASKETLKADMDFLLRLWDRIQGKMERQSIAGLLHEDLDIALRSVRDLFTGHLQRLIIDSPDEYKHIMEYINKFAPELKYSVELYGGHHPIFDFFRIEHEISRALDDKVHLKSGAYIVIERTEALTSIDVNTGRYVGENNLEETFLKTNLEAVKEIARQLRLRSIGGIIVIDFISMENRRNREIVHTALKDALSKDKAKTNVLPMSDLGLIEMTRKRTRPSLSKLLTEPCVYCKGKGRLKAKIEICYELMRNIEKESLFSENNGEIIVAANASIGSLLKGEKMEAMIALEKKLKRRITIVAKDDYHLEEYKIYT